MALFGRKPRTAARMRLYDPEFSAEVPGGATLRVDYDPALWVRFPVIGQDRTAWVEQVLAAFDEDCGWTTSSPEHVRLEAQLNEAANQSANYTATFLMFHAKYGFATASLDVVGREPMLSKYGDPEDYLGFVDASADPNPARSRFGKDLDTAFESWRDEHGARVCHWRLHRVLRADPETHLVGVAFAADASLSGEICLLFAKHTSLR